jgi:hypothetical protein
MSDPLLTIRIPNEDEEIKKELKYLDRKINEYRQTLIYLESQDCRNCLLKETIDEQKSEATAKFRLYINAKHELLDKINKIKIKDNNESDDLSK